MATRTKETASQTFGIAWHSVAMSQAPAAAMLSPDGPLTGIAGDAATVPSAAKGSDMPLTLLLLRLMLDAAG